MAPLRLAERNHTSPPHAALCSSSFPHHGIGPSLACEAQLQAVETSIPVALQHLS